MTESSFTESLDRLKVIDNCIYDTALSICYGLFIWCYLNVCRSLSYGRLRSRETPRTANHLLRSVQTSITATKMAIPLCSLRVEEDMQRPSLAYWLMVLMPIWRVETH